MDESLEALKQWLAERYADNELLSDIIRRADEQQLFALMKLLDLEAALRGILAERYADNELLSATIRRADEQQLFALAKLLSAQAGSWGIAPTQIYDEVQNNRTLINTIDAVQCTKCGKYFWIDRKLKYCTYCGTRL